ncbi:hypothetical protein ARA01_10285 (plasmid) [Leuconostoc mesenteroides subsp. mesenteroides]|uniref:glycoside hydrolase family 32 protein n=1 Tax=Leuconostoc mesenteroides TaxID=1245 RepID=UPI000990DC2D|nr:glycoside hydrolase family 32 protein [Leuconostoc mesenteroides]AQU50428.1 hypothetical protein ARA01_10285 [Leuconostoc mesenteroides subsp. mesenteroides]
MQEVESKKIKLNNTRYRLGYHIMAPSGWINDPNGFCYFQGYYHIFYQHYPNDSKWGPMHWGHARSKDLVHWESLPIALTPGDKEDEDGCFSGSAVVYNGKMYLIYTGHHYYGDGDSDHFWQNQNLAISEDGIHFEKYENNPIISQAPEDNTQHFRDPKVWYNNGKWYLILGSQNKQELGRVLLYKSDNLIDWILAFYEQGILNNKTLPFENVAEIKKYNDQFNALKNELADVEENIRAKQAVLKITDQALTEVDLAEKQIDTFKQALSKNLFGKTVLKPDDLDRFKSVLGTMKKATLQSQHETEELKQTLGQVKAQLADVQADYQNLKETHQVLQQRQRDQQQLDYAMRDMLKNDYGVDKLSHTDVEARYVLYKLDHEELTKNKKVAQSWLKTLTTARADPDTKIAPTRLDHGIEQVKALIHRIIELTRDIFKGPSL